MASEAATADQLEEEERLVAEAQAGNLDAMRPIFERYAATLYATAILPRVGNPTVAEDVLRDTLATAVQKLGSFTWQGKSIYPWLRQIAVNKAYDVHRKAKRSQRLLDALSSELPAATSAESRADVQLIVEEERRHNRLRIDETLAQLSERYQQAIRLRLIDERPREDCAAEMEITVGNFDVVLFRAVRAFRKRFGDRGG